MSSPRRRTVKIVYNGVDAQSEISKYLEKFTYEDSTDKSDMISLSVADRDLKWREAWIPEKGDTILPSIIYENWNYEGEKIRTTNIQHKKAFVKRGRKYGRSWCRIR